MFKFQVVMYFVDEWIQPGGCLEIDFNTESITFFCIKIETSKTIITIFRCYFI